MPFDEHTLVFKVMDKMFTFATLRPKNGRFWADMKCNPDKREGGAYAMGHACELETSLYLYLDKDAVRTDQIRDAGRPDGSGYFGYGMFNSGPVSYLANFSEFTDTGAFGRPSLASAEKGKQMFEAVADGLEQFIKLFRQRETMCKKE